MKTWSFLATPTHSSRILFLLHSAKVSALIFFFGGGGTEEFEENKYLIWEDKPRGREHLCWVRAWEGGKA